MTGQKGPGTLTEGEIVLLREIVRKWHPTRLELVDLVGHVALDDATRELLRESVATELSASGYLATEASRKRGQELDDLIDKLGDA